MQDFQKDNFCIFQQWFDHSPGGLTIAEIAKWREIVQNIKCISQQWKDSMSQITILKA